MTLTSALSNATSGLRANARAADLVAANVANALTPGYARRELALAPDVNGSDGGVRIVGVNRVVDPVAIGDRRLAEAAAGGAGVLADALKTIEDAIGDPTQAGSLNDRIAQFSARMVEAASRPDIDIRLESAVWAARSLAEGINQVSQDIQTVRTRADTAIGLLVEQVNVALAQVQTLNGQITRLGGSARDSGLLQEQRQQVIDGIADVLPIREVPRDDGAVALFTTGGAVLLEGRPRALAFSSKGVVEPWMSLSGGALSGLSIGGVPLDTTAERSQVAGGALQAQFDLRDRAGPDAQGALDAIARDLVERFQDPTLDSTLGAGDAGLFTDNGAAFASLDEEGLALRLSVNTAVDPATGGALWRLRDGLGAAAAGDPGRSGLLNAYVDALDRARAPASGPFAGEARSIASQAALFLSGISATRQALEGERAFEATRLDALREREARGGVDTDDEMQKLLTIEQAYGANARVIQTLDDLMNQLLRI